MQKEGGKVLMFTWFGSWMVTRVEGEIDGGRGGEVLSALH